MQNPYTYRSAIRDPQLFFGRIEPLNRLFVMLANGQSVSVIGDRRIGKSSLLFCAGLPSVQARSGRFDFSSHLFVYVDLQGRRVGEPEALFGHWLKQLARQENGRLQRSWPDLHGFSVVGAQGSWAAMLALNMRLADAKLE